MIGGAFAASYLLEVALLPSGTTWDLSLSLGAIIGATMLTWMMGRLLRAGLPGAVFEPYEVLVKEPEADHWTLDPDSAVREQLVRSALDDLGTPEALGRNPLARLPGVSKGGSGARELREVLVEAERVRPLQQPVGPQQLQPARLGQRQAAPLLARVVGA